ncbi:AAA family ATPase [Mumia sp. zg.B17]|uniref:AAA family ATPase n=1 Tax=Mumia sp. zg.B17 TaxID=2855446 RepID=UPI001C6E34CD|nr:AAA family ATPase [Mumia sp. zg.B17]MBW9205744.1 AAA family ATPase [Mumia sp. zg.B17]
MTATATLHLMVGLPGVGKTTVARGLEDTARAVRLTPDEWMIPLFGDPEADGKRDILEGRLLWTAHQVLRAGASVVVDFGCWVAAERWAVRAIAEHADARFEMHVVDLPEAERRARAARRWASGRETTVDLQKSDHDRARALFERPSADELHDGPIPSPPRGFGSWLTWAAHRWPSFPDLSEQRR